MLFSSVFSMATVDAGDDDGAHVTRLRPSGEQREMLGLALRIFRMGALER
jgi:hypothetical protein